MRHLMYIFNKYNSNYNKFNNNNNKINNKNNNKKNFNLQSVLLNQKRKCNKVNKIHYLHVKK